MECFPGISLLITVFWGDKRKKSKNVKTNIHDTYMAWVRLKVIRMTSQSKIKIRSCFEKGNSGIGT